MTGSANWSCYKPVKRHSIPFNVRTPLLRVNYKFYPLGKKRSKCQHIPPLRKRQMFSRDQRYRHSYPLGNQHDFKNPLPPLRISLTLNGGGGVRTLNGMAQCCSNEHIIFLIHEALGNNLSYRYIVTK